MYEEVFDARSPILMVPGPENRVKGPKNIFFDQEIRFDDRAK